MFWTRFAIDILLVVFVIACPLMWLVILMQRSKQEGLGAAFGGGLTESVWGAQTSNVLVKATVVLASTFFIICILLARLYTYQASVQAKPSTLQQDLLRPVAPAVSTHAAVTPVAPAPASAITTSTNAAPAPVNTLTVPVAPAKAVPVSPAAPAKTP